MNVLLVKPWGDAFSWYHSHMLGLAYLAGYVRANGHQVRIIDASFARADAKVLLDTIASAEADVVGITAMTHEMRRACDIARAVKAAKPKVRTVLGGPHATARPLETLDEIDALDFTVAGEGETPFEALLERLESGARTFEGIAGLAWRNGHETVYNGPQTSFLDLSTIPQPAVDLYYTKGWFGDHPGSEYRLFASRGCPFKCGYCMRVLGNKVRWRNPEAVVEEWVKAVRYYHAKDVFLHDEIFLYDNPHTHAILDGVLREGLHREARFHAMTHPNLVDAGVMQKAREAGCWKVCIGVESGNNRILRNSHRPYTIEKANAAVQVIKQAGLHPFTFFILGHPGETHWTVLSTIRAAVRINPYEIGLGVMVPYPGTEIYDYAREGKFGYRLLTHEWDAYDRYGGRAMEIRGLSRRALVCYQVLGYLAFFLLNGKIRGMINYFRPKLRAAWLVVRGRGLGYAASR